MHLSVATEFKKGHRPVNSDSVGTEKKTSSRPGKDPGYWKVKIAEPNVWKFKHRYLWEQAHGPIPKGRALIFIDSNENNCTLENLALLTRAELATLNHQYKFKSAPLEQRQSLLALVRLQVRASSLKRDQSTGTPSKLNQSGDIQQC